MKEAQIKIDDPYHSDDDTLNRASTNAAERAFSALKSLSLADQVEIPTSVPNLGKRISRNYIRKIEDIEKQYPGQTPYIYAYAIKRYWHAAWKSAYWMDEARLAKIVGDTDYTRKMSTAIGYVEIEGGAWTLYNDLAEIHAPIIETLLCETPFTEPPDSKTTLNAMGCYWLSIANQAVKTKEMSKAFDLIDEAYEAFSLESGIAMWEIIDEDHKKELAKSRESESEIRSSIGKAAAAARLSKDPKQKAKEWVFDCWKSWQDRPDSYPSQAAFARSMLEKELGLTSQPTIEAWCRAWKKQEADLAKPAQ